jgi:TPR repeat protein
LDFIYDNGDGVPKDNAKEYMFFNLAAAQGDKDSEEIIKIIKKRMTKEQIAEGEKLTREWLERKAKEKNE